jgi:hypothetical protein
VGHQHRQAEGGVFGDDHDIAIGQFNHGGINPVLWSDQDRFVRLPQSGQNQAVKGGSVDFSNLW